MKIKSALLIATLSIAACVPLRAQTTNLDTTLSITNPPTVSGALSDLVAAIKLNQTNWVVEAHGLYAPGLNKKAGFGLGAFYPINDYVLAGIRSDFVDGGFWMPSGNCTFQYPVKIFSWLTVTPFTYAGIGIPLSGANIGGTTLGSVPKDNNGQPTAILGYGGAIKLYGTTNDSFTLSIIGDRETWTGFSGSQYRVGLAAHFKF